MVDEFWRLQRERVGERELADAKAYLTGSFPLTIETPDAIATQVLNVLFYGLPVEELESFRERVNAVSADDDRARRALLPQARSAVDRARRQCGGVRVAAEARRLRQRSRRSRWTNLDLTTVGLQGAPRDGREGRRRVRAGRAGGAGGAVRAISSASDGACGYSRRSRRSLRQRRSDARARCSTR